MDDIWCITGSKVLYPNGPWFAPVFQRRRMASGDNEPAVPPTPSESLTVFFLGFLGRTKF